MSRLLLRQRQRGQAMTEMLVVALVLIPLLLLIPMIGKYQDMAHATQLASRYLAFDAMTRNNGLGSGNFKSADQLAGEVRRRFFSNSNAVIKSEDTAGNFKAHQNMFWRDPKGASLIRNIDSDVLISFGSADASGPGGGFKAAADGKPFKTGALDVAGQLGLEAPGIYTANISVNVANLSVAAGGYTKAYDALREIGLKITRHTSVVVDTWTAENPAQVRSRIDKPLLFPGHLISGAKPLVGVAVAIVESPKCFPSVCSPNDVAPKIGELDFWNDVVPSDRLR